MTKKILGLDLGVASIGWALIEEQENNQRNIIAMGTRLVPLSSDERDEFSSGNSISKNRERATKRTMRRMYDRYQLRREALVKVLQKHGMFNPQSMSLTATELWGMRARAVTEKVSLEELGRILYHLNQKRGYRNVTKTELTDPKNSEHLKQVLNRYQQIKAEGLTIGQKFYHELLQNRHYRVKEQVFPREAYIEEYNRIMTCQQQYYPEILTDELIQEIRDRIIYYQRPLKSQKGLVSVCEFEGFYVKGKNGKEIFTGPKVAPRTSPLFQVCTLWETINNITIKDKFNQPIEITLEQKHKIFEFLDNNNKLTEKDLLKILGLTKDSTKYLNQALKNGIKGNGTKTKLLEVFEKYNLDTSLLQFNLQIKENPTPSELVDRQTGEILYTSNQKIVSPDFEKEPLYRLWHAIYSIGDKDECARTLQKQFGIPLEAAQALTEIDFKTPGFGKKSSKAIRKILPYLMEGYMYSQACELAGYNHSNSLTKDETLQKQLLDKLELLPKNSLRQPVVEKILNQTIRLVNEIIDPQRGWVTPEERHSNRFEIRVELARELKLSKEERNKETKRINQREKQNKDIAKELVEKYKLKPTRNNIIKWRLFHEMTAESDNNLSAICIYCGKHFALADALTGNNIDVEHIIPKSLLFDDSQTNKTLAHRACNANKGNYTAYDFMALQGKEKLDEYVERVNYLYEQDIISKAKRDRLLMSRNQIPQDFIERQLRESQYISRKARQILQNICYTVNTTTGAVTDYLRRIWGYDDILMNLHLPIYREHNLTKTIEVEIDGQIHQKEIIPEWTKRNDHSNHALDALIVACTQQGFIQRINTLSSEHTREKIYNEVKDLQLREKLTLLDKYLISQKPFETHVVQQHVANILVSFKAGKKVATYSTRKIKQNGKKIVVQTKILTPRGALHEESIYGKIKIIEKNKNLKYLFQNPHLIVDPAIREKVEERLRQYQNNEKEAIASLKKSPIYLDPENKTPLETAHCFKEEYVIKYSLENIKEKNINDIIDTKLRSLVAERLAQHGNDPKKAFKEPLYLDAEKNIPVKTVRCFTGLSAVVPLRKNDEGQPISYVKPGNNHHVAIYTNPEGNKIEHVCSFWHAVERKKHGIPIVIEDTRLVWNTILNNPDAYPQAFQNNLPPDNHTLVLSMQQNETFLLGLTTEEATKYINEQNYAKLSRHLFRVQKISSNDYLFRLHLDSSKINDKMNEARETKKIYYIKSIGSLFNTNPIKVAVNILGQLTLIQNPHDQANALH